jgi:hypothetical protein
MISIILNMNSQTTSTIPNISTKIRDLSATKLTYLKMIIEMFPLLKNNLLCDYANQLIILLQNLINITNHDTLIKLESGLISVLLTYIFDINELVKGQLNLEKYEPRHKNLSAINQQINYHMNNYDKRSFDELKASLFLI